MSATDAGDGVEPLAAPTLSKSKIRRKLWDVPHKYHCPIIGTCLSVEELRRIADRTAQRPDAPLGDFAIHVSFVSAADHKNPLSLATQKLLEKKYAASVRRYAKARDPEALLALWSESLATGEVPGGLWALMTHPKADHALLTLAYEEVHMLSHQIGAGQRADLKRLAETRAELERLQRDFDTLHKRSRHQGAAREARISELESALGAQERIGAEERERIARLESQLAATTSSDTEERIARLTERLARLESSQAALRAENARLNEALRETEQAAATAEDEREAARTEARALERHLAALLDERCDGCDARDCAECRDLAGRLVLCVGGRKPLVEQYRAMVARCNGRFDHHDGGLEDHQQRLETMLASADLVVCATDYVSHGAYYRTKRFCKRHEKPHVLLGNSGIASFALAIDRLAS